MWKIASSENVTWPTPNNWDKGEGKEKEEEKDKKVNKVQLQ